MVDSVMNDPAYDGQIFHIAVSDVPEKKTDLVSGKYELPASQGKATVAVKKVRKHPMREGKGDSLPSVIRGQKIN
jgi:hypothetical protein